MEEDKAKYKIEREFLGNVSSEEMLRRIIRRRLLQETESPSPKEGEEDS